MGLIYATLEVINAVDSGMVRRNLMPEADMRREQVQMLVDSGAYMLCLNEHLQTQLGLDVIGSMTGELADGSVTEMPVAGPVELRFGNRRTSVDAVILPGTSEPLLGSIPMEDMDVLIDPKRQQLVINPENPYIAKKSLK